MTSGWPIEKPNKELFKKLEEHSNDVYKNSPASEIDSLGGSYGAEYKTQ
jgi:hypothetical protein